MKLNNHISRRRWISLTGAYCAAGALSAPAVLPGQDATEPDSGDPSSDAKRLDYIHPQVQHWRIGMILNTRVACTNVFATFPIPRDWPEQKVTVIDQVVDPQIGKWETREIPPGAKQVALSIDRVPANSKVQLTLDFKIERTQIVTSKDTDDLVTPKRTDRSLKPFFGDSPHIDASNARIKKVARKLMSEDVDNAWQRVEQIYDWVRDNIKYRAGDIKNASVALKDGKGDCEEMTSLVVALCRNARIPARMVWVHEHCYPEFCLADEEGNAHWFPCQAAGTRQFGTMQEYRPILQKGDRFKVKETKSRVRYVAEFFRCDKKGKGNPKPTFIRQSLDA